MAVNEQDCVSETIGGDDLYCESTEGEYNVDNPYGVMEEAANDTDIASHCETVTRKHTNLKQCSYCTLLCTLRNSDCRLSLSNVVY